MRAITDEELGGIENTIVFDSFIKARSVMQKHEQPLVSISGGSDSDVMLDVIERVRDGRPVTYIWMNTGLEYQATKDHLKYLEEKYGITIERQKPIKSIPTCCREYGQPFMNKYVSEKIERLQRIGFQWEDEPLDVLLEKYPTGGASLKWWTNYYTKQYIGFQTPSQYDIGWNRWLKEFLMQNPPTFRISSRCCEYSKKKVYKRILRKTDCDLNVVGVRKSEGGIRSVSYKTCYTDGKDKVYDKTSSYRPIFWYGDDDKRYYEEHFGIVHSDCYTKYGLRRTGCVGCPHNKQALAELARIERYEPNLVKACRTVFRDSYEYTQKYRAFYDVMQANARELKGQMTIFDFIDMGEKTTETEVAEDAVD